MTPEQFTKQLQDNLGQDLRSVILFGSAVSGDQTKKFSNFNILVLVRNLSVDTLKSVMSLVKSWRQKGNPSPLMFTDQMLLDSRDVFPIEFLDIQSHRRVLYGMDPFEELKVSTTDFRHQLEYELRGKLVHLRSMYLESEGKESRIQELLARSLSPIHVLYRAVLRMMGKEIPGPRLELWKSLGMHVNLDVEVLEEIFHFREGAKKLNAPADVLFSRFLKNIEAVIEFVDQYKNK